MTAGLVASLAAYCAIEFLKYKFEMRRGSKIAAMNSTESEAEFTESLTKLAQIQKPAVIIEDSISPDEVPVALDTKVIDS